MQLHHRPHERDHDLPSGSAALLDPGGGRLGDRADLHPEQPRDRQAQPHPAQAEHRVGLVQAVDRGEQALVLGVVLRARGARRARP